MRREGSSCPLEPPHPLPAHAPRVATDTLFHYDPAHDDEFMDRVAGEAEAARPGTLVAREGMVLTP